MAYASQRDTGATEEKRDSPWLRFGARLRAARERTGRLLDDLAETAVDRKSVV